MRNKILSLLAAVVLVLALGSMAKADTMAGGISYSFTSTGVPESGNTYDVTLTVNTTGAVTSGTLDGFSVQFTGATAVELDSASAGTWSAFATGPHTAGGCNSNPGNHWCIEAASGAPTVPDGVLTFVFDVTMPAGSSLPTETHIQAFQGQGALAISNNTDIGRTTVPEPGTLTLLGTGLLGLVGLIRRRLAV